MAEIGDALRAYRRGDAATARRMFRELAEAGNARACALLAQLLSSGEGGAQDAPGAVAWYARAAEQDDAAACLALGALCAIGKGGPQDWSAARRWYERAAALGEVEAHVRLGLMAAVGQGAPMDQALAERHWRAAAARGHATAMVDLARLLASRGAEQLAEGAVLALDGLMATSDGGLARSAEELLGWMRPRLERLATEGSAVAGFALGGMAMLEQRPDAAARWFGPAADAGHAGARRSLAFLLEQGQGVDADLPRAVELYRLAALDGDAPAQWNYAVHLELADPAAALEWMLRAAEHGLSVARIGLADRLLERGRADEAVRWLRDAAESGDPTAMLRLTELLVSEPRIPRDLLQAARWCFALLHQHQNGDGIHQLHAFARELGAEGLRAAARLAGDETLADAAVSAWAAG
jgi:uncharacterized protein